MTLESPRLTTSQIFQMFQIVQAFQIFTYTDEIQLDFLYCPITFSMFFSLTYFATQPSCSIQTIEHDLYNRTSHIGPTTSTTRMTSPMDTPFTHRLLLAHLHAATSIATTFQNLPLFTPQPLPPAHQPFTTPTSSKRSSRRTPPPPPPPTPSRSRSPPHTTGQSHLRCKPEPSPSSTPTSPHQHSPTHHKDKTTQPRLEHKNNTDFQQQLTPPITPISLNSSPTTPPQPFPPPPSPIPPPSPVPPPKPPQNLTDSPPYLDNGGCEPSDDEKLAAFKLNKRARPSWKYIAKALNKTPFDCKGRWQVLQILYTPQPPESPETEAEAASPHKTSHQAEATPPATRDASTMTTEATAPSDKETENSNTLDSHRDPSAHD